MPNNVFGRRDCYRAPRPLEFDAGYQAACRAFGNLPDRYLATRPGAVSRAFWDGVAAIATHAELTSFRILGRYRLRRRS
jgi:hypothetical protein